MILLIDNYDSFTYNLVDYLLQMNVRLKVIRNDDPHEKYLNMALQGIVLSPGPGRPENSGNLMQLIRIFEDRVPILGICLGHQALGMHFGSRLVRARKPMHGKRSLITVNEDYLFEALPRNFHVVRYHSLILENPGENMEPIALTNDNEIMAIRHSSKNLRGVQFHPEAILTDYGFQVLENWISYNRIY